MGGKSQAGLEAVVSITDSKSALAWVLVSAPQGEDGCLSCMSLGLDPGLLSLSPASIGSMFCRCTCIYNKHAWVAVAGEFQVLDWAGLTLQT